MSEVLIKNENNMEEQQEEVGTNPELKSGYIVELKDGTRGLIVSVNDELLVYWAVNQTPFPFRSNNSLKITEDKIVKVYKNHGSTGLSVFIYSNLENGLIWTRPEPVVELTLQQIADKFEVDVTQLKIKEYEE